MSRQNSTATIVARLFFSLLSEFIATASPFIVLICFRYSSSSLHGRLWSNNLGGYLLHILLPRDAITPRQHGTQLTHVLGANFDTRVQTPSRVSILWKGLDYIGIVLIDIFTSTIFFPVVWASLKAYFLEKNRLRNSPPGGCAVSSTPWQRWRRSSDGHSTHPASTPAPKTLIVLTRTQ